MRLIVLGATGMLGYQIFKNCLDREIDVMAVVRNGQLLVEKLGEQINAKIYSISDVKDITSIEQAVLSFKPDYLINCIGIIKQSSLAENRYESIAINSFLPHQLEKLGSSYNFKLIHISTDCVFDGKKGMYKETDESNAYDLYGKTKFLGEVAYGSGITIRTSIIGHELSEKKFSLIDWFLTSEGVVKGYTNAFFSGLTTYELTKVILDEVIGKRLNSGLYQVASKRISKYDLLKLVSNAYNKSVEILPSDEVVIDRSLDGTKFEELTGKQIPEWPTMINEMYADFLKNHK